MGRRTGIWAPVKEPESLGNGIGEDGVVGKAGICGVGLPNFRVKLTGGLAELLCFSYKRLLQFKIPPTRLRCALGGGVALQPQPLQDVCVEDCDLTRRIGE